jgi:hypothetical protein
MTILDEPLADGLSDKTGGAGNSDFLWHGLVWLFRRICELLQAILPLPPGEGWGEGIK